MSELPETTEVGKELSANVDPALKFFQSKLLKQTQYKDLHVDHMNIWRVRCRKCVYFFGKTLNKNSVMLFGSQDSLRIKKKLVEGVKKRTTKLILELKNIGRETEENQVA